MATFGWKPLLAGFPWFRGEGRYPLPAYSEFMAPPRLGRKPYPFAESDPFLFTADDPAGWHVTEYEEAWELRPGLEHLAQRVVGALVHLAEGKPGHGISHSKLSDNLFWSPELAERAGGLAHERFVVLMPLALSRTQDDKGRVRWTLFGGSEQGPARAFWKSFATGPKDAGGAAALAFFRDLLHAAYGEPPGPAADLRRAGFRILPQGEGHLGPVPHEGPLPDWTTPYIRHDKQPLSAVKYLLTFRPFDRLPAAVRHAYLAGELHLLPFPGSLLFWGSPFYFQLQSELPLALQIPLLHLVPRYRGFPGLRVPQSGWMHEPHHGQPEPGTHHGPVRNTFQRTHRWDRVLRDQDELALLGREDKLLHVLFSSIPDDLGLYDKPLARNVQLWTKDARLLLDGPNAAPAAIKQALEAVEAGGLFGYRFLYPAMRVGRHEIYWHRPLTAYWSAPQKQPLLLPDAPLGYLTAYRTDRPQLEEPVELWPRLCQRPEHLAGLRLFQHGHEHRPWHETHNIRKLLDTWELLDGPLPRTFARRLLSLPRGETIDAWLDALPARAGDAERGSALAHRLREVIAPEAAPLPRPRGKRLPEALTFARTARRAFEVAYWKTIAALAEGKYLNKNNADCVRDPVTQSLLTYPQRDLDALGDYLLAYYRKVIAAAGMTGKALAGDVPFRWRTDFDFSWSGGWLRNQDEAMEERDLLIVIPGRDRRRAVIMADHYDTAYMADRFEKQSGGRGARLAASGADDNHSATAALMLAAPVFLELSRAGRLGCDVWLVHLTGEEFPADCLGARHLCQRLVEGALQLRLAKGRPRDLANVQVSGVYVSDMIAHNNDHDRDVFQISPGTGRRSMELAYAAHLANETWNAWAAELNRRPARRGRGRGRRSPHGGAVPEVAEHLALAGEVRPAYTPRSTLYNTDGQIFSDAGVPVVLFMENYDINRTGYHDSHDTMANIDLDYGAALAAVAIEAVARATHQ
jgi:hypothetical protein